MSDSKKQSFRCIFQAKYGSYKTKRRDARRAKDLIVKEILTNHGYRVWVDEDEVMVEGPDWGETYRLAASADKVCLGYIPYPETISPNENQQQSS